MHVHVHVVYITFSGSGLVRQCSVRVGVLAVSCWVGGARRCGIVLLIRPGVGQPAVSMVL